MAEGERTCPRCAESVKSQATICRFCGHNFEGEAAPVNHAARDVGIGCAALVLVVVVLTIFFGGGESSSGADSQIRETELSGPNLNVHLVMDVSFSSSDLPGNVGQLIREIGRNVQSGATRINPETRWLQVRIDAPSVDRLGREAVFDAGNLRFPIADLEAANYANLDQFQILNLADTVQLPTALSAQAARQYCADEAHRSGSDRYCALVDGQ